MKIIENYIDLVEVSYFGIALYVPKDTRCIATDKNGATFAYVDNVMDLVMGDSFWLGTSTSLLCKVDLQGKDWRVAIQGYNL